MLKNEAVQRFLTCLQLGPVEIDDLAAEAYKLLIESQDSIGEDWRERRDKCLAIIAEIIE